MIGKEEKERKEYRQDSCLELHLYITVEGRKVDKDQQDRKKRKKSLKKCFKIFNYRKYN